MAPMAERLDSDISGTASAVDQPPLPVLIVEDRAEELLELEEALAPLGLPLSNVRSVRDGLQLLLEHEFGVVLFDVRLLDETAPEIAETFTQQLATRQIPLLVLTATREKAAEIVRSRGPGPIDYVLTPLFPELLRAKVASYSAFESRGRAVRQSDALLRGAFEAAPIGKTVLDSRWRIVRVNPAFARLAGKPLHQLHGAAIAELCHPEDRALLSETLRPLSAENSDATTPRDLRLQSDLRGEVWVQMAASAIESSGFEEPLLLAQWVDLTARRGAEHARAELLLEQAARVHAESVAERLEKLHALSEGIETLSLRELAVEFASRLLEMLDAELVELEVAGYLEAPVVARARAEDREARILGAGGAPWSDDRIHEVPLMIERARIGRLRLLPATGSGFGQGEFSLLNDAADRIALSVRGAQLHEEEHRVALVLQRGLLPGNLPSVQGIELAVHYEAAGLGAEVGGDWYDAFELPDGRLGIVVGDVAGSSFRAASAMGQLRTVTRTFAVWEDGRQDPGEVLTKLNRYLGAQGITELFTVVYGIVDPASRQLVWAAAGHPPPLLRDPEGATRYLRRGGGLLGIETRDYETLTEALASGTMLVLYTDGLVERRGEALDEGLRRLADAAASGPEDPQALAEHILGKLLPLGLPLGDDVTALVTRVG
jgi:PAS domain S-box-containing protein